MNSAEVEVFRGVYYDASKNPIPNGLLDPRLGPSNKTKTCLTCNGDFKQCPGHFGYLNLALPVYNVGYLTMIVDILKCICKVCEALIVMFFELLTSLYFVMVYHKSNSQLTDVRVLMQLV
nr:DNA-directed RNA polymerase III subunit 1-like isoform X1 [Ipomoea batatas]